MPRPSVVGKEIYDQVEELMAADPDLSRVDAFKSLEENSGRSAGTISANYYREARNRKGPTRRRRTESKPPAAPRVTTHSDIGQLGQQLIAVTQQIVATIERDRAALAEAKKALGVS